MKRLLGRLLTATLLAGLAYGGWIGYQSLGAAREEQGLGEIPTRLAAVRDITVTVSATGVLQPVRVVQVKSKAAGEIIQMPVELGDAVGRGALIAQIDTESLTQELQQAEADLESARTRQQIAERQLERAHQLVEQDLISQTDLETTQQSFATARAGLLRSEADVKLRQERFEDATVQAPIRGTIIKKEVEEGQIITSSVSNVSGGTTLVEMADLGELEVRTLVAEIDIGRVQPRLAVESTVEAFPRRRFQGEVIKIEPQAVVQEQVTTFPVLSRIDNGDGLLLPGMNAAVDVIIHRQLEVLAVPNEAVRTPRDAMLVAELLGVEMEGQSGAEQRGYRGRPGGRRESDIVGRPGSGGSSAGSFGGRPSGAPRTGSGPANGGAGGAGGASRGGGLAADPVVPPPYTDVWGVEQEPQPAVVFLLGVDGGFEPRSILAGVRDWEYTEVVEGLRVGDEVILLPSTSLLNSQQALRDRFSRFNRVPGTTSRRR